MSKLYEPRSLLYRRQILQENIRWKALDEIYKIYMLLHRSDLNISENVRQRRSNVFFLHFSAKVGRVRFPESREERALMASASMRETRVASSRPTERTPVEKLRVSFAVIRPRNSCAMCVLYCIDWLHLAFARKGVAKSGEKS